MFRICRGLMLACVMGIAGLMTLGTAGTAETTNPAETANPPTFVITSGDQYTPGQTVSFSGTGWTLTRCGTLPFQHSVDIVLNGSRVATGTPDLSGSFSGSFKAPMETGPYAVKAVGVFPNCTVFQQFEVVPEVFDTFYSLDNTHYATGGTVTFSGDGWGCAKGDVTISVDGNEAAMAPVTEPGGMISGTFTAPTALGAHVTEASNPACGPALSADFEVGETLFSLDDSQYSPGATVAFSGVGWKCTGGSDVTVSVNGATVATATPSATGSISGTFTAPGVLGNHIALADGNNPACGPVPAFPFNTFEFNTVVALHGYWTVASDGGVFSFGEAAFLGSMGGTTLNKPVVGMAATPDEGGYWLVASDGGIFAFGDAAFHGSTGDLSLNSPIVGMAPTPDGGGYWLVAADGGIFAFGDAGFFGSMGGKTLNSPVVGMAAMPDGNGYWLVTADGDIFNFGDAVFAGSAGNADLNRPIVGMAATPDGGGYWLTASDGGIFTFGDARFFGSTGALVLNQPIVDMAPAADAKGYWLVASDGGIFAFGDAGFFGSMGGTKLNAPMVGMAAL
jgi:hypothetical protein